MKGRLIETHKISKLNRQSIEVCTLDEKDSDGANHKYRITVRKSDLLEDVEPITYVDLQFQQGGLAEVGPNGITDQALLAIVLDRMMGFQQGPFWCKENMAVISSLKQTLELMEARYKDRAKRNVEGVRAV